MTSMTMKGLKWSQIYKNTNRKLKIEYTKIISQSGSKC